MTTNQPKVVALGELDAAMDSDCTSCFVSFAGGQATRGAAKRGCFVRAFGRVNRQTWRQTLDTSLRRSFCCGATRKTGSWGKVLPSRTVTRRSSVLVQRAANPVRGNLRASHAQPSTFLRGAQFPPGWVRAVRRESAFSRPVCAVWQSRLAASTLLVVIDNLLQRCLPIKHRRPFMIRRRGWNCQPVN